MNDKVTHTTTFSPFKHEDLGSAWRVCFGVWRVKDGKLCHILPEMADDSVESVISGAPDAGRLHRCGALEYLLPARGFERMKVGLTVAVRQRESFIIDVDEWGVEWRPADGMQATLTHVLNATPSLDYDTSSVFEINTPNRIDIIAEPATVRFFMNGREMFSTRRSLPQTYRRITVTSVSGAEISDVVIEGEGLRPAREPAHRPKPVLAATVDFGDDVLEAPYTAEMLDILVKRLADMGIRRIYWLHSVRVRPEALGPSADPALAKALGAESYPVHFRPDAAKKYERTILNCYPFLPKVCGAAHKRGMEVYSIHKTFDLGFFPSRGNPSAYSHDHFQNEHTDALFQRYVEPDEDELLSKPVGTIRLYKDNAESHGIRPEHLSVWVSDDNNKYVRVSDCVRITCSAEQKRFRRHWEGDWTDEREVQVITITGLNVASRYLTVIYDGPRGCTFRNRLYRLTEILDKEGHVLPFTRNLPGRPKADGGPWNGDAPFVFRGFTSGNCPTGCWVGADWTEQFQALDGGDVGIAFERGHKRYLRGTPSPAHPASARYWTAWIQDAINAGVDGIELRITTHTNPLDWANYGFGPLVAAEFKKRYGHDLRPDISCRRQHMELLGNLYTDFVRKASIMARRAGKKFQHHIWRTLDNAPGERGMCNVTWDWRRWIKEGLLDAVTLKTMHSASNIFDDVMELADAHGVETMFCPYLNCFFSASASWQQQMTNLMDDVVAKGMSGITLYETAAFMRAKEAGDVVLAFPELADLLARYQ